MALSFAEVETVADLCCPDAAEILKEGRKEQSMCGFSIWYVPKKNA